MSLDLPVYGVESVYYRFNGFTELWVAIVGNNSYFCRIGIIDWDYEA